MNRNFWLSISCFSGILLLTQCSTKVSEPIEEVRQFYLKNNQVSGSESGLIRAEMQYRLHGAVTKEEVQSRLGRYYTVIWNAQKVPVDLIFEYQQGGSQSKIIRQKKHFSAQEKPKQMTTEFAVIGKDFFVGGDVLSWKITLVSGGKTLAKKTSYLWRDEPTQIKSSPKSSEGAE